VGQAGSVKTIALSNATSVPVLIGQIDVTHDFRQSNNCPTWLPEKTGCLVFVAFAPAGLGQRSGELDVTTIGSPRQSIPLSGIGVASLDTNPQDTAAKPEEYTATQNDEERAQEKINDQKYTFEHLLAKNPGDVSNSQEVFRLTKDTMRKLRIASILASIGVRDEIYLDYLTDQAKVALSHDQDMPWPMVYDDHKLPQAANPQFVDWCRQRDLPFWDMYRVSYYEVPRAWYFLAAAGDPRSYDLLIRGLRSPNLMIAATAAQGLAKLQDPRAIAELIAAGHREPGEALGGIVQSLIYFSDPKAQSAADEIIPEQEKNMLQIFRREKEENGTKALFPW